MFWIGSDRNKFDSPEKVQSYLYDELPFFPYRQKKILIYFLTINEFSSWDIRRRLMNMEFSFVVDFSIIIILR